jgi:hypothetical protein
MLARVQFPDREARSDGGWYWRPTPLHYERWSDQDVDMSRKWIAKGALDDD